MKTAFTELLHISYPIVQAPIGSATTPELVAAVSKYGGLGTLALSWCNPDQVRDQLRSVRRLTDKPFAVNFVLAFDQEERINICIEEQVPVFCFSWGDCTRYLPILKARGIIVGQAVSNAQEALYYEQKGLDFLIAQGWEAGGHVSGTIATSVLIPALTDKVNIPVIAAGGIASGRGILAALALGASGASLGTRFLMTTEAAAHPLFKEKILRANENDTHFSEGLFNIGWDNAPHRTLRNSTVINWKNAVKSQLEGRPGENEVIGSNASGNPILRYSDTIPLVNTLGNIEAMALYAGQSAGLITNVKSADEIMSSLIAEIYDELQRLNDLFDSDPNTKSAKSKN